MNKFLVLVIAGFAFIFSAAHAQETPSAPNAANANVPGTTAPDATSHKHSSKFGGKKGHGKGKGHKSHKGSKSG